MYVKDLVSSWESFWLDKDNQKGLGSLPEELQELILQNIEVSQGNGHHINLKEAN